MKIKTNFIYKKLTKEIEDAIKEPKKYIYLDFMYMREREPYLKKRYHIYKILEKYNISYMTFYKIYNHYKNQNI